MVNSSTRSRVGYGSRARTEQAPDVPGQPVPDEPDHQDPVDRLRFECRGVRVSFRELGREKKLSDEHKHEIAESLEADEKSLRLGKRILDSKEEAVKKVNASKSAIEGYWKGITLPYPTPGLRLIREADISPFVEHIQQLIAGFDQAVIELDAALPGIIRREEDRLGRTFNPADYPSSVRGLYGVSFGFENVEPPEYLRRLAPELYEREAAFVRQRFAAAAAMAEEALEAQFQKVLSQLVESLRGVTAGTQRSFKDNTVDGIFAVFDEFTDKLGHFGIGQGSRLEQAIESMKRVIQGHDRELLPNSLRKSVNFRQEVIKETEQIRDLLTQSIEERPRTRRRLLPR